MKFIIKHEIKGRIRLHVVQKRMSFEEADTLQYYLSGLDGVMEVKVREQLQDVVIRYTGSRAALIEELKQFHYEKAQVPEEVLQNSGRALNAEYWEKLVNKLVLRAGNLMFLPAPVQAAITTVKSVKYIWHGVKTLAAGKLEVPVLDATAIGISMLRGDVKTAGSVMFLLGIGELLEEWTHKKSVGDLARSMSLNVNQVWLLQDGQEIMVPRTKIQPEDQIVIHMGNVIPFDGLVTDGEAMVNQSSLTGEALPVRRIAGNSV